MYCKFRYFAWFIFCDCQTLQKCDISYCNSRKYYRHIMLSLFQKESFIFYDTCRAVNSVVISAFINKTSQYLFTVPNVISLLSLCLHEFRNTNSYLFFVGANFLGSRLRKYDNFVDD